jgi:hypothetical protein
VERYTRGRRCGRVGRVGVAPRHGRLDGEQARLAEVEKPENRDCVEAKIERDRGAV